MELRSDPEDKDWSARFENPPGLRRGCLTIIAIPLALASALWAWFQIELAFYDSIGNYRPPDSLAQFVGVLLVAATPFVVPAILIFIDFKKPRARKGSR